MWPYSNEPRETHFLCVSPASPSQSSCRCGTGFTPAEQQQHQITQLSSYGSGYMCATLYEERVSPVSLPCWPLRNTRHRGSAVPPRRRGKWTFNFLETSAVWQRTLTNTLCFSFPEETMLCKILPKCIGGKQVSKKGAIWEFVWFKIVSSADQWKGQLIKYNLITDFGNPLPTMFLCEHFILKE